MTSSEAETPQPAAPATACALGLAGVVVGAGLAILLLANPFRLAALDTLRHRLLGERAASMAARTGESNPPSAAKPGERRILFYRNPMDPTITSPAPMKDSMGMDYVPVYADEAERRRPRPEARWSPSTPPWSRK